MGERIQRVGLGLDHRERLAIPTGLICGAITVIAAHGTVRQILVVALYIIIEVGLFSEGRVADRLALVGLVVAGVCSLVALVLVPNGIAEVPLLSVVAMLPRVVEGRPRTVIVAIASVGFGGGIWYVTGSPFGLVAAAGAWLLAERTIEHAELIKERDRAMALLAEVEASRDAAARAAAGEERGRIAREMHDVLAHSLAGLSLQIQAVRAVAARHAVPPEVTDPLDRAADLAREGVAEARAVVGALRPATSVGVEALPTLVERFPGEARLVVDGTPGEVNAAAGHAVYRAVQESLTNAARYAPGAPVTVTVTWGHDLAVRVADGGRPPGREPSGVKGSGAGLAGMAERLTGVGGTLTAGPDGAGWNVELHVPAGAPVAQPAPATERAAATGPAPDSGPPAPSTGPHASGEGGAPGVPAPVASHPPRRTAS